MIRQLCRRFSLLNMQQLGRALAITPRAVAVTIENAMHPENSAKGHFCFYGCSVAVLRPHKQGQHMNRAVCIQCAQPQLPAALHCMCVSHVCLIMEEAIHPEKSAKGHFCFYGCSVAVLRPHTQGQHPCSTPQASCMVRARFFAANAAPHPKSCTMIEVHVKASFSNRSW